MSLEATSYCAGVVALLADKKKVSAVVSTMGLLSNMMKQVHFQVFCHFEGEITLNTGERFVFSMHFHCTKFSV